MTEIIAIVNRKGGVGKTATAQALGAGLMNRGYSVLYIDLDSQTNLSYALRANTGGPTTAEVLSGTSTTQEAIQRTEQGHVIAGSPSLAKADATLTGTGKEYRLREILEAVTDNYDYIIIDTPAALGALTVNALTAATGAIIPVQPDIYSLQGIGLLYETIAAVKKYCNRDLVIKGILLTRYNDRTIIARDMKLNLEEMAGQLQTKLYSVPIRENIAVKEAQASRRDIFSYAPRSNAAQDYNELIEEFIKG